jgi:predicted nucleotidyltransferase component of viral defense system
MLNRAPHELVLKRILFDFYSDAELCVQLGFKGGTCLYLFHGLDRFSTDLDFNITGDKLSDQRITYILEQHLKVLDVSKKRNTFFWLGSFEKGAQKVKVEIGRREYPDHYETQSLLGLTVRTMTLSCMFAHKLCAITDRKQMMSRDVYDAWFLFKKNCPVDEQIVELRTGKTLKKYYSDLIDFIGKHVSPQGILQGLGDVLEDKQKVWVKQNLINELTFELRARV